MNRKEVRMSRRKDFVGPIRRPDPNREMRLSRRKDFVGPLPKYTITKDKEKRRAALRRYSSSEKGKACALRHSKTEKWKISMKRAYKKDLSLGKIYARVKVGRAVRLGNLIKTGVCSYCMKESKTNFHHHKGYEPENMLEVIEICTACHGLEHRK